MPNKSEENTLLSTIFENTVAENNKEQFMNNSNECFKKEKKKLNRIFNNAFNFRQHHTKIKSTYFKNKDEVYDYLSNLENKDYIVNMISSDKKAIKYLNKIYMETLNSIYQPSKNKSHVEQYSNQQTTNDEKKSKVLTAFIAIFSIVLGLLVTAIKFIGIFVIAPLVYLFIGRKRK